MRALMTGTAVIQFVSTMTAVVHPWWEVVVRSLVVGTVVIQFTSTTVTAVS